ncbi:alpha/beta hydrolase [Aspergillus lucknowensis]|uniref:TAP-like protein-domain-containing protein n=1 Tax=Aspergillus lucknowensis TaxID=176173 RepID=A0ABR4LMX3_9EURO
MMCSSTAMKWLAFAATFPSIQVTALSAPQNNSITLDDWSSLSPSPDLRWVPCFENYTCARLQVPLDYGNHSRGNTTIAFIKLPAKTVTKDTQSVLVNPGGPGASGIDAVLSQGIDLAEVVQGKHNVVGFDPRGVGRSGPVVDCWPNHPEGRAQFERLYYPEISNASSTSLGKQFAAADIFGKACTPTVGGSNGTAAFVTTPAVSRDMLSFLKAEQAAIERSDSKLWYYGLSYGTVLGATFAHLFPDKVGRMILDGVIDAEDYYSLGWTSSLYDADRAIASFIESCFDAGQPNCSFWGDSVENIRSRLDSLLQNLKYNPIPISPSDTCPLPMLATYSDLKQLIFQAMYFPLERFSNLATILSSLERGNTTAYAAAVTSGSISANPCNYDPNGTTSTKDINTLIRCTDGASIRKFQNISQFEAYVNILNNQSHFFGEVWPNNANGVACRSLEVSPPSSGRLSSSILDTRHTASPILFVTNEVDPVTPKRGAYKMSSVFPGSVVLTQDLVGHTAFGTGASACVVERIQRYLLQGELPAANTTCPADFRPFQGQSLKRRWP